MSVEYLTGNCHNSHLQVDLEFLQVTLNPFIDLSLHTPKQGVAGEMCHTSEKRSLGYFTSV
jgi:hypothetical protein